MFCLNASVSGSPCTHVRNAAVASPGTGKISSARPSLTAVPDWPCIFGPHRRPSDARRGTPGVAARNGRGLPGPRFRAATARRPPAHVGRPALHHRATQAALRCKARLCGLVVLHGRPCSAMPAMQGLHWAAMTSSGRTGGPPMPQLLPATLRLPRLASSGRTGGPPIPSEATAGPHRRPLGHFG